MKTMNSRTAMKVMYTTAIALFLFATSCKDQDAFNISSDDNSNLQSDASVDAQAEDISDVANVAMVADAGTTTGGRSSDVNGVARVIDLSGDTRFSCATVTLEFALDNNPQVPAEIHGYIVIDFGTGCTGPNGRVRKGKINIEFQGRRFIPGSFINISTDGYSVDGIGIAGERTELNKSASTEEAPQFHIEEDVTITFLDGSTATRSSTRERVWNRAANPLEDTWTVTGTASGTTRRGHEYVMNITNALLFKRSCAIASKLVIPVQGTKQLIINGKEITTDFGTGNCDTTVTITINGRSKEINVSPNGD